MWGTVKRDIPVIQVWGDRLRFHFNFLRVRPLVSLVWGLLYSGRFEFEKPNLRENDPPAERFLLSVLHTCPYMSSFLRAPASFAVGNDENPGREETEVIQFSVSHFLCSAVQ